jgi:hypothetical protein
MKDWLYIAKRIPQVAWAAAQGAVRSCGPHITVIIAVFMAHAIGMLGANVWLLMLPIILAGFALSLSDASGEARAAVRWGDKLFGMISDDHTCEITVTNKTIAS